MISGLERLGDREDAGPPGTSQLARRGCGRKEETVTRAAARAMGRHGRSLAVISLSSSFPEVRLPGRYRCARRPRRDSLDVVPNATQFVKLSYRKIKVRSAQERGSICE